MIADIFNLIPIEDINDSPDYEKGWKAGFESWLELYIDLYGVIGLDVRVEFLKLIEHESYEWSKRTGYK